MQVMPCSICQSYEHLVEECPTIPAVREMFGDQAMSLDNSSPITMLHMEIPTIQIGGTIQISPGSQEHFSTHNQAKHLNKLQILSKQYAREGRFPSQPHQNPKVSMKWKLMRRIFTGEDVKALITLGVVKVNIPLLDMIKQVPTYAKFLKDLLQVSSEVQRSGLPYHLSDDWRNCSGESFVRLGASVNLLPYSVYKQLGLGELKPTSITLSLADRSVKIPRGIIEDVLVQVDNFYYPVDFVVLDTDPIVKETNYVPIILGRPFLATSNAIINCRNGLMQLTFGNMTLELNIFYMSKSNQSGRRRRSRRGLPEPSDLLATLPGWRRIEEILPLFNKEEAQEAVKEEPQSLIEAPTHGVEVYIPRRE
ncbi:hypothetical protein CK203_038041 [Vitis vinifera]|uniref:Uncharacterized protein n=1 Tax=Vitis vinifera TaxID=29760 RepID=A0A438HNX8_VITVI|nr:hypothetical protein CK203_038041 [Vitis vinifera]